MSVTTKRQMTLVAFLQAQNCSNYAASWRHPATAQDFATPQYYQRIARTLEEGKFDLAFFDDRLAMPDIFNDDYAETVRHGIRAVKMDLPAILMAMGLCTQHLGLGATYSTTYYEPYHVARVFATLDLMTGGRVAWNVVTSLNDAEAANFGRDQLLDHDTRYDRADEFMEIVHGHWDSWEDGAIVQDRVSGLFADPAKVRRIDYAGRWLRSRGPLTVPRSAQGHPVIIQAGQSGRGREFAARWAELVFVIHANIELAKRYYQEFKQRVIDRRRDPTKIRITPAIYAIVGETQTMAEDKMALIDNLAKPIDALTLLSEVLNFDFGAKGMDEPFTADELASATGLQGIRDRVIQLSGLSNPTVRDFLHFSGRGTIRELPAFVGNPGLVADHLEEWFNGEACDGFVLAATHMPGSYEDFVRLVLPELQRRGLFRTEYPGSTLRETLGFAQPALGSWRAPGT
ncbi:MAG: LLM class flavin-dependent oxidoreductase [Gammaproteobacteria bacterium]|nr:LLM class flavin-dependent oxidoreductase [Gammaproteobacteria bacterium]